jgi:hypothetical protein
VVNMGTLVQLLLSFSYFKSLFSFTKLYCVSFRLFRFVSLPFVSLIFAKITFSRNTKFSENALYFREITKLVSLPFRENFAKRNSVKNPTRGLFSPIPCLVPPPSIVGKANNVGRVLPIVPHGL